MHEKISTLKSLAWDWIPSLPYPKLLEANAEYSLLLPQLFNFKKTRKREKGCTEPLYGKKAKCVIKIIPQEERCDTMQIDKKCIKTRE